MTEKCLQSKIKNHIKAYPTTLRIDVETASHIRHTKTAIESGAGTQGLESDGV